MSSVAPILLASSISRAMPSSLLNRTTSRTIEVVRMVLPVCTVSVMPAPSPSLRAPSRAPP